MADCILLFCAHLCAGELQSIWSEDWVVAKTLFTNWRAQNPAIEVGFFATDFLAVVFFAVDFFALFLGAAFLAADFFFTATVYLLELGDAWNAYAGRTMEYR